MMDNLKKYTQSVDNLILFCLCLLIIGLPFSITFIEIMATIAITLWLFKKIFILRSLKIQKTPLNWPILIYLIFVVLSLVNSQFLTTSLRGLFRKTLEYICLYFVIVETVKVDRDVKKLVAAVLLSCALIGIDGLWQYFTGYDFLRAYPIWSTARVKASFKYPTGFGAWLITVIPFCISLAIFNTKERLYRISGAFLSLLLLACLILNLTRGAWFAFIFAITFLMWMRGDTAKKVLLLLLVTVILGIGLIAIFGGAESLSLFIARGWSFIHRMDLAKMCWRMFVDHPFLGHGINTFMSIYERYSEVYAFGGISYAHNCYLQITVETGVFSLLAFLWMIAALFTSSMKDIDRRKEGFIRVTQLGLLAGLLAYLVHSAVETNLYSLQLAMLFYYVLGLTVSIQNIKEMA